MKTAELTGALLDYWVARAEGWTPSQAMLCSAIDYRPSTNWGDGGPLIEKYNMLVGRTVFEWAAESRGSDCTLGDTPLQAICRAVVRAAFGDEVEEVAVC